MAMRRRILKLSLVILPVALALSVAYYFLFLHFVRVPTASMANTVIPGDCLVVKKRAFGEINRGNLIVFRYSTDPATYYLSRVVGLPGESLEVKGRIIYINGKELPEQRVTVKPDDGLANGVLEELSTEGDGSYRVFYFSDPHNNSMLSSTGTDEFGPGKSFQIPVSHYFVMGDNRDNSADSRIQGTVPRELIFGKPTMIYWSSHQDQSGEEKVRWERVFLKLR